MSLANERTITRYLQHPKQVNKSDKKRKNRDYLIKVYYIEVQVSSKDKLLPSTTVR